MARATGTIENGDDQDWWRIDVKADHLYTFSLASAAGAKPGIQYHSVDLYDKDGNWIDYDYGNRIDSGGFRVLGQDRRNGVFSPGRQ